MGREVESVAISKGITITDKFDIYQPLDENTKYSFDVAIEFTNPDSVIKNIEIFKFCFIYSPYYFNSNLISDDFTLCVRAPIEIPSTPVSK